MGFFDKKKRSGASDAPSLKEEGTALTTLQPKDGTDTPETAKPVEFKRAEARKFLSVHEDQILRKPIITEKTMVSGTYVFEVARDANRIDVKKAFFNVYGIDPIKVNVANQKGKVVRFGRTFGRRKDWKKATVILKKGDKIDTF